MSSRTRATTSVGSLRLGKHIPRRAAVVARAERLETRRLLASTDAGELTPQFAEGDFGLSPVISIHSPSNGGWSTLAQPAAATSGALSGAFGIHAVHSSPDGRFQLKLRPGGDLWLTTSWAPDQPYWSSGTGGSNADAAVMQGDGNFVLYRNGVAVWSTGTSGNPGSVLMLQDDGNLVVYAPGNVARWNSQTSWAGRTPSPAADRIVLNEILSRGQSRYSPNHQLRLVLQEDGNLVLYAAGAEQALWHTHTFGQPVTGAIIHPDGNFALYNTSNQPVWDLFSAAQIPSRPGAYLRVQDDGNLVLYDPYSGAVWSSNTRLADGSGSVFVPPNNTQAIAVPPGHLNLPASIVLTAPTSNAGVIYVAGRPVVLTGGNSLEQSGAINAQSLIIGQYQPQDQGTNLTTPPAVPTIVNLAGNATITAAGGVTVDGILGLSIGNVVTADTPVTVATTGRLRGAGTIAGTISVSGVLAPAGDAAATSPHGQLKIGQLSLQSGSLLELQVAGPGAGAEHDQIVVTGGVSIGGALLSLDASYAPRGGSAIVLIDNRGSGPVSGTFRDTSGNALPEGATVVGNLGGTGRAGFITYKGGDGNDVCLLVANAKPTGVSLAVAAVAENQPAGTVVGTLSTTDPDAGETFSYLIVPDPAIDGTTLFEIVGNQLRTKQPLDFEGKASYSVRVRSTDSLGLSMGKIFTVTVSNANDKPSAVSLSRATVVSNRPAGTVVGTFSTVDQDAGDTFTYTLFPDPTLNGTDLFEIVGNELRTKAVFPTGTKADYSIRVRSFDRAGLFKGVIFTVAVVPPGAPMSVTNVVGTPGAGHVALTWTAPDFDGGAKIKDYVVQYSSNNGSTWRTFADAVSAATSARVTGLLNGTNYVFRVLARNALGTSLPSVKSAAVAPRTLPGAPVRLTVAANAGSVSLGWSPPANMGGSTITDYLVEFSSNNGTTWRAFTDAVSATPATVVNGLTNGVAYVFRVRAVNVAGRGAYSLKSTAIRPR